jgi:anti-anti-sigma factor
VKIRLHEEQDRVIITIRGSMSQDDIELFRVKLLELLDAGKLHFILDLGEVPYISSLGLAVIVDLQNRTVNSKGSVAVARLNPLIKNLFFITNLVRRIPVYDKVEQAMQLAPSQQK